MKARNTKVRCWSWEALISFISWTPLNQQAHPLTWKKKKRVPRAIGRADLFYFIYPRLEWHPDPLLPRWCIACTSSCTKNCNKLEQRRAWERARTENRFDPWHGDVWRPGGTWRAIRRRISRPTRRP
ncbi:hypothetical protein BC940DRAFT_155409 [Gongronella butleri]|nr:hypothetical protein BC940DRAFT_155409 [Gongronella butleri]